MRGMEIRRRLLKEVMLFTAMVFVEFTNVVLATLFKAATLKGLSYHVFLLYTCAVATLALLPLAFIFRSTAELPSVKFPLFWRICLLGLVGFLSQMLGYKGIAYSSPTLASAISNLTPAFTFILAIIFRMEKLGLRSRSTQAKVIGTIVSISGAFVVVLYKGPTIFSTSPAATYPWLLEEITLASSSETNWIIGGLLLASEYLLLSIWYIIQTQVMEMYPAEIVVVFLYNLCATVIAVPVCFLAEEDLNAWRIKPDIALVSIIYAGFTGSSLSTVVHSWGLHLKGPMYVAIFKPLSVAIAAITGVTFLHDDLHLGSVIGAVIICIGFYAVLWGTAKDEDTGMTSMMGDTSDINTPLLQSLQVEDKMK